MKRSPKAAVPSSRADRTVRSAQGCSVRCFPVEAGGRDRRIRLGRSPAGGLLLFRFSRNTRRISVFENRDRDRLRFRTLFPSFSLRSRFGSRYDTHPPTEPIKRGSERTGDDPEPVEPRPTRTDSFVPAGVRPRVTAFIVARGSPDPPEATFEPDLRDGRCLHAFRQCRRRSTSSNFSPDPRRAPHEPELCAFRTFRNVRKAREKGAADGVRPSVGAPAPLKIYGSQYVHAARSEWSESI